MPEGGDKTLGTLSVLFTDVVGSTAQRARLGDDAADRLHQVHDEVVGAAISAAGGRLVKGLGDGAMATFTSAADAVAAAIAIQQGIDSHGRTAAGDECMSVRIGVSIGDVSIEHGDVFGTAVVEASRLCGAASGGEILVAELARALARGRGGFTFEPVGEVDLRGLPEPVETCRVLWEPLPSAPSESSLPLPAPLSGPLPLGFVGRDDLLDAIAADWEAVRAGAHRSVLLAGEPGIGKTRLAAEAARAAHAAGATVLFGRCDEDLSVPYQPFVEALEHQIASGAGNLPLGRLAGELARLVPQVAELPGVGSPVPSDARSEEFRLFEAVTSWLTDAAEDEGLVLVLDDLHWASKPTLQMLNHVLRHAPDRPGPGLLTLVTYRDTDIARSHPLVGALADLRRLPGVTRHPIGGLSEDDVVRLAALAAGHELDEVTSMLAGAVHGETEGNPFFVGEVLRHLIESGAVRRIDGRWQVTEGLSVDVPEGVRDVVGRRASRLSEDANRVLAAAAVVGRDVPLDVLVEVAGLPEDPVLDALDEAVRARLLEETGADRYRFAHALVRTTLYEELSATRARRMHRRSADAFEKLHPDDVLNLAKHLLAAGPDDGDVTRACRAVLAAGEQAIERRSPADAEVWFCQALELLEDAGPDEALTVEALVGLGIAQRDQGDPRFRETLLDASRRAVAISDVDTLLRAVLANGRGYSSIVGRVDHERVELIQTAIGALDELGDGADPRSRARLTALLASEVVFAGDPERQRRLTTEAVELARATDDVETLADVMVRTSFGIVHHADPEQDLRHSTEAVALADQIGDPSMRTIARIFAAGHALTVGRIDPARALMDEAVAIAEEASPHTRWAARCQTLKFVVGAASIEEASAENDACLAMAEPLHEPDDRNWWAAVYTPITWLTMGDTGSIADLMGAFAAEFDGTETWRLAHAWGLAGAGRHEEARALMADPALDPHATIEDCFPYLGAAVTAHTAFILDDHRLAAAVQEVLEPHAERWTHSYLVIFGPITYPLGLCAAILGDLDRAVALLEDAVERCEAAGLPVLANRARIDLGDVMVRRDGATSASGAVLDEVVARADEHGAVGLAERARLLRDQAVGSS